MLTNASSADWGLEGRILTTQTHALLESVIGYGLAIVGTRARDYGFNQMDSSIMQKAAREITGANVTIIREILHILADLGTPRNHYILKLPIC